MDNIYVESMFTNNNRLFIVLVLGISLSTAVATAPIITQFALAQSPSQQAQMQQQRQQQSQLQTQTQQSQLPTLQQQGQFQHPEDPTLWGQVISNRAEEESMRHSSNPVPQNDPPDTLPQDINRETPRDGVGNVQLTPQEIEKHPAFHAAALCSQFPGAPGCEGVIVPESMIPPSP